MNTYLLRRGALSALLLSLLIPLVLLPLTGCGKKTSSSPTELPSENIQITESPDVSEQKPVVGSAESVSPPVEQLPDPPSEELFPAVTVPGDIEDIPAEVRFPYTVPGYDLVIEHIAPYSGPYLEDGSNREISQAAMLLVRNDGSYPIEFAEIALMYDETQLLFDISALPAGERLVVQEKNGAAVPDGSPKECAVLLSRRDVMDMSASEVSVVDNGDNSLTVRNLTDQTIPTVRLFYKYFDRQSGVFVGGIAYTAGITQLAGKSSTTVYPAHFNSQSSRIVMVLTYDEIN